MITYDHLKTIYNMQKALIVSRETPKYITGIM